MQFPQSLATRQSQSIFRILQSLPIYRICPSSVFTLALGSALLAHWFWPDFVHAQGAATPAGTDASAGDQKNADAKGGKRTSLQCTVTLTPGSSTAKLRFEGKHLFTDDSPLKLPFFSGDAADEKKVVVVLEKDGQPVKAMFRAQEKEEQSKDTNSAGEPAPATPAQATIPPKPTTTKPKEYELVFSGELGECHVSVTFPVSGTVVKSNYIAKRINMQNVLQRSFSVANKTGIVWESIPGTSDIQIIIESSDEIFATATASHIASGAEYQTPGGQVAATFDLTSTYVDLATLPVTGPLPRTIKLMNGAGSAGVRVMLEAGAVIELDPTLNITHLANRKARVKLPHAVPPGGSCCDSEQCSIACLTYKERTSHEVYLGVGVDDDICSLGSKEGKEEPWLPLGLKGGTVSYLAAKPWTIWLASNKPLRSIQFIDSRADLVASTFPPATELKDKTARKIEGVRSVSAKPQTGSVLEAASGATVDTLMKNAQNLTSLPLPTNLESLYCAFTDFQKQGENRRILDYMQSVAKSLDDTQKNVHQIVSLQKKIQQYRDALNALDELSEKFRSSSYRTEYTAELIKIDLRRHAIERLLPKHEIEHERLLLQYEWNLRPPALLATENPLAQWQDWSPEPKSVSNPLASSTIAPPVTSSAGDAMSTMPESLPYTPGSLATTPLPDELSDPKTESILKESSVNGPPRIQPDESDEKLPEPGK